MKIATWNVNSVRVRCTRLLTFLESRAPDVLCLQELKVPDREFPFLEVESLGYHVAAYGEAGYNGVAILSRQPLENVTRGLGDGTKDAQRRLIAASSGGIRYLSVYVPNGGRMGSDKYAYKKRWLGRLRQYLQRHHSPNEPLIVCGDFNVAPRPIDIARPHEFEGSVLFNPEIVGLFEEVMSWGLIDIYRRLHTEGGHYSWWDYRQQGFERDDGMRIDLFLVTKPVADRAVTAFIDRDERIETEDDKPSDHAPVVLSLDWSAAAALPSGQASLGL